ncbi:MAG: MFS transporter [Nitrososphaerota archaeon]|nr:MFS transporter [Nitrososphaerota archaeon]
MHPEGAGTAGEEARSGYLGPGFVLALSIRLLSSALVIVIPLFAVGALGVTAARAGGFVLLLWVGNALGVASAAVVLRDQTRASVGGFSLVALSMAGLALGGPALSPLFIVCAGAGVGLPQPFLSAFMHLGSPADTPFSGLGLYSAALGAGLILGPLVAYGAYPFVGFGGVFLSLAAVCAVGLLGAALGREAAGTSPRPPAPSPRAWARAFRTPAFTRAVTVNFLYSLLLPAVLSFGGIYAEAKFGFTPEDALLLFTVVFVVSVCLRLAAIRLESRLHLLFAVSLALLLASALLLGFAPTWEYFVLGMLLFSVPHAFVFPIANFRAFRNSGGDVINASYVFQGSSAAAEFISPAAALFLIPFAGIGALYLIGAVLAGGALLAAMTSRKD